MVIQQVRSSSWATPIVPLLKKNAGIRICGDFKVTIKPVLDTNRYPLPTADELFASLSEEKFCKIDLSQAYQQMILENKSQQLLTIKSHKGLHQFTRLPFGVASEPAIFQRTMDIILQVVPGVIC